MMSVRLETWDHNVSHFYKSRETYIRHIKYKRLNPVRHLLEAETQIPLGLRHEGGSSIKHADLPIVVIPSEKGSHMSQSGECDHQLPCLFNMSEQLPEDHPACLVQ